MNIQQYLPSDQFKKRATIIGVVIVVITAGTYLIKGGNNLDRTEEYSKFTQDKTDTDNDGLRDWEEEIWGTDLFNPDSDGDGAEDGEEVKNDRDPLKASNDLLTDQRLASVYSSYKLQSLKNINITEQLTNQLLPHTLMLAAELEQNNNLSDTSKTDLLIKPIIEKYKISSPEFSVADIKTIPTTAFNLLDYFNTILEISNATMSNNAGSEIALVLDKSKVDISKLQNNYRLVINAFIETAVPETLAPQHVVVLNNFLHMQESFELLVSSDSTDSAKTIYALDQLHQAQNDNRAAISALATQWRAEIDRLK